MIPNLFAEQSHCKMLKKLKFFENGPQLHWLVVLIVLLTIDIVAECIVLTRDPGVVDLWELDRRVEPKVLERDLSEGRVMEERCNFVCELIMSALNLFPIEKFYFCHEINKTLCSLQHNALLGP